MSDPRIRPHAAHSTRPNATAEEEAQLTEPPSRQLTPESEQVHALLEKLDDVIFAAMSGDEVALAEAHALWPQVIAEIGWPLIDESREQYLRFAIDIARQKDQQEIRQPEQSIAALEVISLLMKGA